MALFLYRYILPVLEGKYHLVIVYRDAGKESADIALVEGNDRSGKTFEEGSNFLDLVGPLGLQSTL